MSKVIVSPVKRFAGNVVLSDPLTFPQRFAYEDALAAVQALDKPTVARANYALLPGILACVEKWNLDRFPESVTPDTFPATPAKSCAELLSWLVKEVSALYQESEDVPLA